MVMGGTAEHVQAKSLIDSMLQLIQRVCPKGEGLEFGHLLLDSRPRMT